MHFFCLKTPDSNTLQTRSEASLCSCGAMCLPFRARILWSHLSPPSVLVTSLHSPSPFPQDGSQEAPPVAGRTTRPLFSWNCPMALSGGRGGDKSSLEGRGRFCLGTGLLTGIGHAIWDPERALWPGPSSMPHPVGKGTGGEARTPRIWGGLRQSPCPFSFPRNDPRTRVCGVRGS